MAITVRNQAMIDRSDLVVGGVARESGGAYRAMRYAQTRGAAWMNLAPLIHA